MTRENQILLGLRSSDKILCPDTWDVIGGHLEQGESEREAIAREMEEEIGVRPTDLYEHSRHALEDGGLLILYQVTAWLGDPARRNDEHSEIRWFPISTACALTNLALTKYVSIFRSLTI